MAQPSRPLPRAQHRQPARRRLAINEEVVSIPTRLRRRGVALSDLAVAAKTGRLAWRDVSYNHAALYEQLREWSYEGQTPFGLHRPSVVGALVVFTRGLLVAVPKDLVRARRGGMGDG